MNKNGLQKFRIATLIVFTLAVVLLSWQSDDAYHGYVMARRLAWGQGFVYNLGERATASTCPLFTLIIAFAYALTHEMFFTSLAVCAIFSAAAYYVLSFRICKDWRQVALSFGLVICSEAFMSYTSSGLENSLLFFLGALFIWRISQFNEYPARELLILALLISLTAMARMDSVLLYVPVIVYVYLFRRENVSFPKAVGIGFLGLSPFILWEAFACFYYGFPFPNPAYVKLGTQIATSEYVKRGILYYIYTGLNDCIVIVVPLMACLMCLLVAVNLDVIKYALSAAGILLYLVYIIRIGGDFMMGRHFTNPFFVSLCVVMAMAGESILKGTYFRIFAAVAVLAALFNVTFGRTVGSQYLAGHKYSSQVSDEREYYIGTTGLYNNIVSLMREGRLCVYDTFNDQAPDELRKAEFNGGIVSNAAGIVVYKNPDLYLNDTYALGDPFLSKLPVRYDPNWRVGHIKREVPEGYQESIWTDSNRVKDPALHEYYDVIRLITRGDLWSRERLKAVLDMNLGKYNGLLSDYAERYLKGGGE